MADNAVFQSTTLATPPTGTTVLADQVVDGTLGTGIAQYVKIMDGTIDGTAKATAATVSKAMSSGYLLTALASDSPGVTALGQTTKSASLPVAIASDQALAVNGNTVSVANTPTVTAGTYAGGNKSIGGIQTFAAILPATFTGVLQSIGVKFKATVIAQTISIAIFKASPSNGTYTDGNFTYNAADAANLIGLYVLPVGVAWAGSTSTFINLDGIGKAFTGSSTSLFAVVTASATLGNPLASTSDMSVELGVLQG